jgi:hypothetical protein
VRALDTFHGPALEWSLSGWKAGLLLTWFIAAIRV